MTLARAELPTGVPVQRVLAAAVLVVVAVIAAVSLRGMAAELQPARIGAALRALPSWRLAAAVALTVPSYLLLTCYDALALRSLGLKVPLWTTARASFTSYALSHNLGFGAITGGSARLRIYGAAGVPPLAVARLVVLAGAAFWGGIGVVAGVSLIASSHELPIGGYAFSVAAARIAGCAVLGVALVPALPLPVVARLRARLTQLIPLPSAEDAAAFVVVAGLDLALAAGALMVLVPGLTLADFPQFFLIYALAVIAGLLTHVPGGMGVFEAVMLASLPVHGPAAAGALIAYRAIYYLAPLALALLVNAVVETPGANRFGAAAMRLLRPMAAEISPYAFGAMTFGGGLVLLFSGALPAIHGRMRVLVHLLPQPFIEASHLSASLVGTALLLVAPALVSRLESGMRAARLLFLFGAGFSLAKGLDFEEATIMLAMAGLLQLASPAFYRQTSAAFSTHNRGWLFAAVLGVVAAAISGSFAYHQLAADGPLWWQFALHGDAPRFLRASFATGIVVAAFAARELLHQPRRSAGLSRLPPGLLERATACSARSDAALALTGDKQFLISRQQDAFLMFRPRGRTWVVMGDPVGPRQRWRDLAWELRRASDRHNCRLCFYQCSDAMLAIVIELGLRPLKYGEEAHIDLARFTLAGPAMKSLRNSHARARRDGLALRLIDAAQVPASLPSLRLVSDAWLAKHGGSEKNFSLGTFDADYLRHFDLAVVAGPCGEPLAFANIWRSGNGEEFSIDLMRQSPEAPPGTMDFLLVELFGVARDQGYRRFNLGVAPLSGIIGGKLAPGWSRAARLAFSFRHVGYNFRGLRRYKDKFAPEWTDRFVALPPGIGAFRALLDVLTLIS